MVEKDQSPGEQPPANPNWRWGDELKAKEKPAVKSESAATDGKNYTS